MTSKERPFRDDRSKVLVSSRVSHEEPTSIEPGWTGDRGDDYGEEVWFDLKTGSFRKQQTHKHLSYDINTGEDTSWYYPDRVDAREYSILDLPSMGFNIDSIDDRTPWCVAGPIADYLRNQTPLQSVESLTAIYASDIGRDHVRFNRCILPRRCAMRLSEQILDGFASGPDDGLTAEEAFVSQALGKLGASEAEGLVGETRAVAKSVQEVMKTFYPRGVEGLVSANDESSKMPDWYCPETGQYVMSNLSAIDDCRDTCRVHFEAFDVPFPELSEEASRHPNGSMRLFACDFPWDLNFVGNFDACLSVDAYLSVRSVAKRIATEGNWVRVDGACTIGGVASSCAKISGIAASFMEPVARPGDYSKATEIAKSVSSSDLDTSRRKII